jgi:hypothetical protein
MGRLGCDGLTQTPCQGEDDDMPHDEVDDTEMTPAEFHTAAVEGLPVRVVTSRQEYEAELGALRTQATAYVANIFVRLALVDSQSTENTPARAVS